MHCQNCSAENPQGAKFCIQCATPFLRLCEKCGCDNPFEARFCAQCAAPLDDAGPIRAKAEPRDGLTGERRHLTVLFCDLAGSTAISAQLDPEEWRETIAGYHRAAAEATTRFDGHVAKYLGDGVMAYFGWPEAHDNDAERASRAGLAILDAIGKLNEQPAHAKLSARVGIDSGLVVIGKGAGQDADVFGDTPNVAARVEAAAEPGTVVITDATHRLVSGLFVVEEMGAQTLKGIERPVQFYRVIRPSGIRGRFEAAAEAGGLTQFVGREDELRSLMNRWERILDGEGQVALIIGEAGIGKSRLLQRFHEQIVGTPHTWVEASAGAFFQNTPFYPVTEILRQFLGDEPTEDRFAQLESRLAASELKAVEAVPLIAPLLNLPLPAEYPPSTLSPEQQRRRLLATLVEWVLGSARVQPLAIAIEDLHWVDPSTLELIQLLVEQCTTARLLLLYTARPEFRPPWPLRAHHAQITLNRLGARDIRTMVAQVAASKALSDDTVAAVVERTGGVPLFVEELTRAVLESGDAKLTGREIPATLHDSLMARLDRLGPAKEIIQIGAVLGSEFPYELLHAVHPIAEDELQRALRKLTEAELLYVRGIAPDATYQFKHALIRDAAYEALLKSRRKELHLTVARTIDEKFPALKEAHPEVLARHLTETGEAEPAIAAWSRAAEVAEARNAFKEALDSYQQALAVLNTLPKGSERDALELGLSQSVVRMLQITKGYSAPETNQATERISALAESSGNLIPLVNLTISKCATAFISGNVRATGALADQALDLSVREGSPTTLAGGHMLQVIARYQRGDFSGVEHHFMAGLKFFDDPDFRRMPGSVVSTFAVASWSAWMLGRSEIARERMSQAMAVANENNPYDIAFSGYYSAQLRLYIREYEEAEALAARALEVSEKYQFPHAVALSCCTLGQALAELGRATEGAGLIRRGIASLLQIGSNLSISHATASLASAQERDGLIVEAIETVERALQANPDELYYRPEALRLRGELKLRNGSGDESHEALVGERDFREAIELARSQGAKSWELRATMSLAWLLDKTDRRDEARTMLADIYNWFTEGFDTADLKDAKALIDDLAG
jgi:class 3 adenylate cyclase/tetratricopeptide (TPR) repeat protein